MNVVQKVIKYCAMAFAVFLSVAIFGSIIAVVLGLAVEGGFYDKRERINLSERYSAAEIEELGIERILIDCPAEILVKPGTELAIEAQNVTEDYRIRCSNGTLRLESKRKSFFFSFSLFGWGTEQGTVVVTLPEGYVPKEFKIDSGAQPVLVENLNTEQLTVDSGAGNVTITALQAEKLHMDTGSGRVSITDAAVKSTSIDSGAGRVKVENSELGSLHLNSGSGAVDFQNVTAEDAKVDSGSGAVEWSGTLTGRCYFDTGSGRVSLQLTGKEEDYRLRLDSGSGDVRVNGRKTGDGSYGTNVRGELQIDSGSGAVNIRFEEDQP